MTARSGYGATVSINGTNVGELVKVSGVTKTRDQIESTNFASANGYKTFVNGMRDGGTIRIETHFDPADAGQVAIDTAFEAESTVAIVITMPTAFGTTWTATANVAGVGIGDVDRDGLVPFFGEFKITGKPALGITASNNITALTCTTGTFQPAFAQATRAYVVTTTEATVTFAATFAAGTCVLKVNGASAQTLTTTVASSAIDCGDVGDVNTVTLEVTETGKTTVTYTIYLTKTA
jgi:hypothetical protein